MADSASQKVLNKLHDLDRAKSWLMWLLTPGPVLVTGIESVARQYGHDWAVVEEAKAALGIEAVRLGPRDSCSWQIVGRIEVPDDDLR